MSKLRTVLFIFIIAIVITLIIVAVVLNFSKDKPSQSEGNNNQESVTNVEEENVTNNSIEDESEPEDLPKITNKGEITKERSIYTDSDRKTVTVPAGYAIIKDSPNVNDGLIISDIADDDIDNSKGGNQFVWVPVETPVVDVSNCKDETDINDAIAESVENNKYPMAIRLADGNYQGVLYRFEPINENTAIKVNFIAYSKNASEKEPANLADDNSDSISGWTQNILQEEYNKLIRRVKNDKGFWVARYETSLDAKNNAQSKKNQKVATNITWYDMYSIEKTLSTEKTTSHMIWGSQWDQIMIWFKDIKNNTGDKASRFYLIDSSNMGNYLDTVIKDEKGKDLKKAGEAFRFKTGELDTKVKQIYDLAGNVWEWTMEKNFTTLRTIRGGDCTYSGAVNPVTARFSFRPSYNEEKLENIGSRMTIY